MEKVRKDKIPFERSVSVGEYITYIYLYCASNALMHSLLKRLLHALIFYL